MLGGIKLATLGGSRIRRIALRVRGGEHAAQPGFRLGVGFLISMIISGSSIGCGCIGEGGLLIALAVTITHTQRENEREREDLFFVWFFFSGILG